MSVAVALFLPSIPLVAREAGSVSSASRIAHETSEAVLDRLEWRGIFSISEDVQFSLYDREQGVSFWIGLGETRDGVTVVEYDSGNHRVILRHDDATRTLSMSRSSIDPVLDTEGVSSERRRFYSLREEAKAAFNAGEYDDARKYAEELLELAEGYSEDWNYGNARHDGNMVLGRLALRDGHIGQAGERLLQAGKTPGSPQLNSFGPNMSLARDLIEAGESEAVLDYFDLTRAFWSMGEERLDLWSRQVEDGEMPDFSTNLDY